MSFFTQQASSGEYVKFDDTVINQPIEMEITAPYSIRESKYKGEVKRYQSGPNQGKAKMESVVPVKVNGERKTFTDGGKWQLAAAVGQAVLESGAQDLEIGGILTVTYQGKAPSKGGQMAGKYTATYTRAPEGAPLASPQAAPAPSSAPVGVPQEAPAPAPAQQQAPQFAGAPQQAPQFGGAPAFGAPQAAQQPAGFANPWANA